MRRSPLLLALFVLAVALPAASPARMATALANNVPPTIAGVPTAGSTLTASNGSWTFTPTSFAYQWQRCDSDGSNCNDIRGATSNAYTLTAADITHTVLVDVSASDLFASNDATSDPTPIVSSANGPVADVQPAISGTAQVGQTLAVSNGSWTPTASTFAYLWQLCAGDGGDCLNLPGATKSSFTITKDDAAHTLRALVTAQTAAGDIATAHSNTTGRVPGGAALPAPAPTTATTTSTTGTTTTTTTGSRPQPTLTVLGLRRSGTRLSASFRVCSNVAGPITITERDTKGKKIAAATRHFVVNVSSCSNLSHSWTLLARFRRAGRLVVTLQARDQTGAVSKPFGSSLVFH
jgi:hypothetical protein